MGLDAVVFCDCVEKGRLMVQHPYPRLLYIARNGSPEIRSKDPGKVDEHDKWMDLRHAPCYWEKYFIAGPTAETISPCGTSECFRMSLTDSRKRYFRRLRFQVKTHS